MTQNTATDMKKNITATLKKHLAPTHLTVIDESHLHKGHIGARPEGGTHYKIIITAHAFENKTPIERHKMIYKILENMSRKDTSPLTEKQLKNQAFGFHALSIKAKTPEETES